MKKKEDGISFLNIGTRILTKDLMDQFIRSLGNHHTHYGQKGISAKRVTEEYEVDIIISEYEMEDTTAFHLIRDFQQDSSNDHFYYILAVEEKNAEMVNIAEELDIDALIVKPFTALDIAEHVKEYEEHLNKKGEGKDFIILLRKAMRALRDKATTDAHKLFTLLKQNAAENVHVLSRLGDYYTGLADYSSAERCFQDALAIKKDYILALNGMGVLEVKRKNYILALEYLSKAQKISPLNPERAHLISKVHLAAGLDQLKSTERRDPGGIELKMDILRYLVCLKDFMGAIHWYKKIKFPPNDPNVKEAMRLSDFAHAEGKISK